MLKIDIAQRELLAYSENDIGEKSIAVLIPCYNEELTIADVITQFKSQLPQAKIYVFDNNSQDRTVEKAIEAGAQVFYERRQGKGFVVRSMFSRVDADIYIMVDGDGTYPPADVHSLMEPIIEGEADMVVGSRLHGESQSQFKLMNKAGNKIFRKIIKLIFKVELTDILSGYRAFDRKFVKGLPLFGGGFEIETELTIKALERGYRVVEIPIDLGVRPEGSHSKIKIVSDGMLIMNTILTLFRDYKPLTFFGAAGLALILAGFVPGIIVVLEFFETGLVPRLPSAVLAVGLVLSGMLLILAGLILHTITRRFQELEHRMSTLTDELARKD
jgi:glycosyltransferase involved in cell wall biosynthesis